VLVEGPSKAAEKHDASSPSPQPPASSPSLQLTGRTHCDRIVVFDGNPRQIGHLLPVTIFDANAHTLFGEVVTRHSGLELFTLSAPKRSEPTGQKEALSVLK
ncbi:MAG TPA: TRAM domain-containing protein, partial [Lacipirellulaceae bacterium]|nr:TRAM domain-containing protein [Lacipirellulaceae bacterium]